MRYIALLRGINVGGNNSVSMKKLKALLEENECSNVITYINSGNVIFSAEEQNSIKLREHLEHLLENRFKLPLKIVLRTLSEMKAVLSHIPKQWKKDADIRCYVAFVREPVTVEEVVAEMRPKEDIDWVDAGPHVVYMTTRTSGLTKSGFTKIASSKIYKEVTIRNLNTLRKVVDLMQRASDST